MMRRLGLRGLAAIAAFAAQGEARADGARSQVAIVRSDPADRVLREASTRLHAELADAGFAVLEVDRPPGNPRSGVEDVSAMGSSFATVAMSRTGDGAFADVWISDRVTGKTVVRRLEVGAGPDATAVLAIRALELLRASLLEVDARPSASQPALSAPPDVKNWISPALPAAPDRPVLQGTALGAGLLVLHGLRGIGLSAGPSLSLARGVGPFFLRLTVADLLAGPELDTAAGSASIRQELASLVAGWASGPRPLGVCAWVGGGAFDLQAAGSASPPYRGVSGSVQSALLTAGVGGLARIGSHVVITAELVAMFLDPRPVVVIAGSDAGGAGAPSLGASLGALVGL
jgi:hypothetical protein